jgi:carboxyl-terminal processing protease
MPLMSRRLRTGLALSATASFAFLVGLGVGGSSNPPVVDTASPAAATPTDGGVLDEAADKIAREAAHPVDRTALEKAAVEGMLKTLGDKWSAYYSAVQYDSFSDALSGSYTGVGLWVRAGSGGAIVVSSVQDGSPAAKAGLRSGDVLLSVGGTSSSGASVSSVVAALRGPDASTVTLMFARAGVPSDVTLKRTQVTTSDVVVDQLKSSVLQIRISSFTRGVGRQVISALAANPAGHTAGVILDLRGNPGGLVDEAVNVASAFLDGGVVVSYETRTTGAQTLRALGKGDTETPLVVLVDGGTASAAEIVTAALQDRNRAVVVGSRTFGKGSVQQPTMLSDGSGLEITIGRYRTPSGRLLDGVGVDPDVSVPASAGPEVAQARALDVLVGLVASNGSAGHG